MPQNVSEGFVLPFNFEEILVTKLAGNPADGGWSIFFLLAIFFIAVLGASFKMPIMVVGALIGVFVLLMASPAVSGAGIIQGIQFLLILVLAVGLTKVLHDVFNR